MNFKGKIFHNIGHLQGSNAGVDGKFINPTESRIFTDKLRRNNDKIYVTELMEGTTLGVFRDHDALLVYTKLGKTPLEVHSDKGYAVHEFSEYVDMNAKRFRDTINHGELIVGEWITDGKGSDVKYDVMYEFFPFAIYRSHSDHIHDNKDKSLQDMIELSYPFFVHRVIDTFYLPQAIAIDGEPVTTNEAHRAIITTDTHYRKSFPKGAVWRWERDGKVVKRAKWIRPYYNQRNNNDD